MMVSRCLRDSQDLRNERASSSLYSLGFYYLNEVRTGRVACTDLVMRVYLEGMIASGLFAAAVLDEITF